jgi:hypothetical protein
MKVYPWKSPIVWSEHSMFSGNYGLDIAPEDDQIARISLWKGLNQSLKHWIS